MRRRSRRQHRDRGLSISETDGCFVAYAAHELRGEIALQLAVAEATLANPNAGKATLREMGQVVAASCERQGRLLEALLGLARREFGRLQREPVDLGATAADALHRIGHGTLTTEMALDAAWTIGDPELIERLVANLVANAVRHNISHGRLDIATCAAAGRAIFTVENTGPVIPPGELTRLFLPCERLSAHRRESHDGVGLGLAIVQAIADAHGATVSARARASGGLRIEVAFDAA